MLHFRIGADPAAPWTGTAPLRRSALTAGLLNMLETALAEVSMRTPRSALKPPMAGVGGMEPGALETMASLSRSLAGLKATWHPISFKKIQAVTLGRSAIVPGHSQRLIPIKRVKRIVEQQAEFAKAKLTAATSKTLNGRRLLLRNSEGLDPR